MIFPKEQKAFVLIMALLIFVPQTAFGFWPFTHQEKTQPPSPAIEEQLASEPLAAAETENNPNSDADDLLEGIAQIAAELVRNLADSDPEAGPLSEGLIVCTFVDLKKLTRTSSLGRHVADQLMSAFQQYGYSVLEIRKSDSIRIQEKRGEYGLSRDPNQIRSEFTAGAMLTGTYTAAGDSVFINARILDNRSSELLSSASVVLPLTVLNRELLADSASARTTHPGSTYMKRLEL